MIQYALTFCIQSTQPKRHTICLAESKFKLCFRLNTFQLDMEIPLENYEYEFVLIVNHWLCGTWWCWLEKTQKYSGRNMKKKKKSKRKIHWSLQRIWMSNKQQNYSLRCLFSCYYSRSPQQHINIERKEKTKLHKILPSMLLKIMNKSLLFDVDAHWFLSTKRDATHHQTIHVFVAEKVWDNLLFQFI